MGRTPRNLWEGWTRIASKIGNFQARILLMLFYVTVFSIFALAVRWTSDPLAIKPGGPRGWRPKGSDKTDLESARRQF